VRDILYLTIVIGFFALCAAYIRACAAIVGHDPVVDTDPSDADPSDADPSDPADPAGPDRDAAEVLR